MAFLSPRPDAGVLSFRRFGLWSLALVFVAAGINHFVNLDVYLPVMPPYLPAHRELIWLSGALEILGGLAVLIPAWRSVAGWGLVLLMVAVFPANLHMALNPSDFPEAPAWFLYVRLPLQGLLIWWAIAVTRPTKPLESE